MTKVEKTAFTYSVKFFKKREQIKNIVENYGFENLKKLVAARSS
jgi:hypothetical protein